MGCRPLRILKLGRQSYYEWLRCPVSQREREEQILLKHIRRIHADDPEYGYRFITDKLKELGYEINEKRIARICSKYHIYASIHKRKGKKYPTSSLPAHDDLVCREFKSDEINKIWFTDITEHPTAEGKIYYCPMKDAFSGRIVGHALGDRMTSSLTLEATDSAMSSRNYPKGVIIHSDRGGQFRARVRKGRLQLYKAKGSMGAVGTFADNASMESFFSLLQKNVLNKKRWKTRQELRIAIIRWVNTKYNSERRQRALGKMTPIEYEAVYGNMGLDRRPVCLESGVR